MAAGSSVSAAVTAARGFSRLPMTRQIGLLVGLSASIALGIYVALWSRDPNYRPLYTHLPPQEATTVLDTLQQAGISYKVDKKNGAILVPSDKVFDARFKLADIGLPSMSGFGFDSFDKDQHIGTSRFMETARYLHALEGELSRTISNLSKVRSARVHLAIPKESVFVTDKRRPTASVLVDLSSGGRLNRKEVDAIVQMVASSVTGMSFPDVTVVDQNGNLLTHDSGNERLAQSREEFDYTSHLENEYVSHIESILTPVLGAGKVRARVSADLDFTHREQTQENYLPDSQVLRSEQVMSENNDGSVTSGGIPGMLSNKPPPKAKAKGEAQAGINTEAGNKEPHSMRNQATRNYELGKMISHSMQPVGKLMKLSVAVIVDDHVKIDPESGDVTRTPLTDDEVTKITMLVKNAVGFSEARGDSISVENISFAEAKAIEPMAAPAIWEQAWFWDVIKGSGGALFVLLLLFLVIRPVLKDLSSKAIEAPPAADPSQQMALAGGMPMNPGMTGGQQMQMAPPQWDGLKQMASEDPKRIAQVMKGWVGDDK